MPHSDSQTFLRELDKKLWIHPGIVPRRRTAADRLRSNLDSSRHRGATTDAAVYKHAVLGLIFLKYVSDSFAQRQAEIEETLRDPESDFHLSPAEYDSFAKYEAAIHAELEERDYFLEKNVFWVPALARWKTVQDSLHRGKRRHHRRHHGLWARTMGVGRPFETCEARRGRDCALQPLTTSKSD